MEYHYDITLIFSNNMTKLVNGQPDYLLTLNGGNGLIKRYYFGTYVEALNIVVILGLTMTNEDNALYRLNSILNNRVS